MYIKLALIIMGVSTLFFAITESFRLPNAKSYFIQILLPIETLLVLYAMIHLMNASKKFRKVMVYNGIYACVLCVISITYIYFMSKQGEKWTYYLLVLCYTVQFFFCTYIYLHITRLWKNSLDKSNRTFRKNHFRIWIEAFIIGLIGIITELYPTPLTQSLFTICYTLFFIHYSILYHNYGVEAHNQIKKIAPALISDKIIIQPEESQEKKILKQNNDLIKEKIDCWITDKKYLHPGITIQDISRQIGINRTYLSGYINETYHTNFNTWINNLRIEEAKRKLTSTSDINLSDLAESVGFADLAHFSKIFKQKEGLPPSVWRKKQTIHEKAS